MIALTRGSAQAYRDLETRSRTHCFKMSNVLLPSGCRPPRSDIGFETEANGKAKILVRRGGSYDGSNGDVRKWIAQGELEFGSFRELKNWLTRTLRSLFDAAENGAAATDGGANAENPPIQTGTWFTDMGSVERGIRTLRTPIYRDEKELYAELRRSVLGQDGALRVMARAMANHHAKREPSRPAVLFAVGPTGVGKTRAAETLGNILKDPENGVGFLRLDMSEYQEGHRVSSLIGAPQGYLGYGEGSQLLDALRANPRTVVLFDEIEKAHPSILRVLMNAMDAGRLTGMREDRRGQGVDCRRAAFLFTSNIAAQAILDALPSGGGGAGGMVVDALCRRHLRAAGIAPEILGRIGRFVVFRELDDTTRAAIVALHIVEIANEFGIEVASVEPGVVVDVMKRGRGDGFGSRPDRNMVEELLGGVFARTAKEGAEGKFTLAGPPFRLRAV